MDALAPARDDQHARPGVPRGHPGRPGKRPPAPDTADDPSDPRSTPLINLSLAALRGLLAATVLARTAIDYTAAIAREQWRRTHQTIAMISHYRRRGDPLPPHLRI